MNALDEVHPRIGSVKQSAGPVPSFSYGVRIPGVNPGSIATGRTGGARGEPSDIAGGRARFARLRLRALYFEQIDDTR